MSEYTTFYGDYNDYGDDMAVETFADGGNLEAMYPDVYFAVQPVIENLVSDVFARADGNPQITEELLQSMSQAVLQESGLDFAADQDTVSVANFYGGCRGRNCGSFPEDLVRILLLRQFFDRRRPHFRPHYIRPRPYYGPR